MAKWIQKVKLFVQENGLHKMYKGRRGRDRMVVGFTTTYVINDYHHYRCEFESRSGGVHSIQH
jgi:hypothetical protein